MLSRLGQDLNFAFRTMRRSAAFTALMVGGLALGIGANAAIYSLIDAISVRKLAVPHPDELVALGRTENIEGSGSGTPGAVMYSYPLYKDIRDRNDVLSGLAATGFAGHVAVRIDTGVGADTREPEQPYARFVSGNFFSVLAVPATLGRTLGPADDTPGVSPVATISDDYWTRRFGRDPSVVGRAIRVGAARVVITGVAARNFEGAVVGRSTDLWLTVSGHDLIEPHKQILDDRTAMWLLLIGRMKPAVTFAGARTELTAIVRRSLVEAATGHELARLAAHPIDVPISSAARGLSKVRREFAGALEALMGAVALLLCIVCLNVANLLLARGIVRTRELALRAALGAERRRIIRQLLTESAVVAFVAAGAAVLIAWWASQGLVALTAGNERLSLDIDPNASTLLFALGVTALSLVLFGLAPALRASRVDLIGGLRSGSRAIAAGRSSGRWLIGTQVALSFVLLACASSLLRTVQRSLATDLGFDRQHLLSAKLDIVSPGLTGTRLANAVGELRERLGAVPGVAAVTLSENGLFDHSQWSSTIDVPGTAPRSAEDSLASTDGVGAGYAHTIGATIIAGRDFTLADEGPNASTVLVNASFAKSYFPGTNPVGRTVRLGENASFRIVGVLADIRAQSLDEPRGHYARQLFYPYLHGDDTTGLDQPSELRLIVRASGDPSALVEQVRRVIANTAPDLHIEQAEPLANLVRDSIAAERLLSEITTALGVFALVLAALGLFAVMSYSVSQRTNEIGIRVALGAPRGALRGAIVGEALWAVWCGLLLGVPLVVLALRFIAREVTRAPAFDPWSLGLGAGLLLLVGAAAAFVPAWRASRVDPIEALRRET